MLDRRLPQDHRPVLWPDRPGGLHRQSVRRALLTLLRCCTGRAAAAAQPPGPRFPRFDPRDPGPHGHPAAAGAAAAPAVHRQHQSERPHHPFRQGDLPRWGDAAAGPALHRPGRVAVGANRHESQPGQPLDLSLGPEPVGREQQAQLRGGAADQRRAVPAGLSGLHPPLPAHERGGHTPAPPAGAAAGPRLRRRWWERWRQWWRGQWRRRFCSPQQRVALAKALLSWSSIHLATRLALLQHHSHPLAGEHVPAGLQRLLAAFSKQRHHLDVVRVLDQQVKQGRHRAGTTETRPSVDSSASRI